MNHRPGNLRRSTLLAGALFAGVLLGCAPRPPTPSASSTRAEAPATGLPTVPVLTYRPHPEADAAARAQYDQIDAELRAHFDYDTGHQPAFASLEDFRAHVGAEPFADIVYSAPPPSGLAASYQRLVVNDLGLLPVASAP